MGKMYEQVKTIWERMELPQKVTMVLVALGFVAIMVAIGVGATRPDYHLLASHLTQAETAKIASYLQNQGVPYKLIDNDTAIMVPRAERYGLLNALSEQELLTDASDGFELLNEASMGESTFFEQKKYDRALAGELERIIREVDGVTSARVLVQRPKESPFLGDEQQASAAVKVSMAQGRKLSKRQLAGIVHLVSGAVGDLHPDGVQVMDDKGLLTKRDEEPGTGDANSALEAEQVMEGHLTKKAQGILDRVLGPGRSLVTLRVDLDFSKRQESSSEPTKPVVVQEMVRETDESTPIPRAGGVAGTAANVEGAQPGLNQVSETATKSTVEETRTYTTGLKTTTLEDEIGRIRGMTVSVLLDHERKENVTENEEGEKKTEITYAEYSQADQDRFQELVLDAIGYQAALGEQKALAPEGNADERFTVTVQSMRMQMPKDGSEDAVEAPFDLSVYDSYIRYGLAIIVALVLLFVARGQLKRSHVAWKVEQERLEEEERRRIAALAATEDGQAESRREAERVSLREAVQQQVTDDPEGAAMVLRGWMNHAR